MVQRALGQTGRGSNRTQHNPQEDVLWNASRMHESPVIRHLSQTKEFLERFDIVLNDSQWAAWNSSLSSRLQLVWGPPGTGKSRTARTIVVGAAVDAHENGMPIRILISANNYNAIDNVLKPSYEYIQELLPISDYEIYRLRSSIQGPLQQIDLCKISISRSIDLIHLKKSLI